MFLHQAKLYPGIYSHTKISQNHTTGMFCVWQNIPPITYLLSENIPPYHLAYIIKFLVDWSVLYG